MKTTSLKTIYLSKDELKNAISDFIAKSDKALAAHVRANMGPTLLCPIEFALHNEM